MAAALPLGSDRLTRMRIVAGKFRSRQLKSAKSLALRPTSDRLRETLFNILGDRLHGSRFLDLFAGTGAIGIEAFSRGASFVVFVENHPATAKLIRENLKLLEVSEGARVIPTDAVAGIEKLEKESFAAFDLIFLDPPYANEKDYEATLRALEKLSLVGESTIVIAEHRRKFSLPESLGRLEQVRVLRQGDAALTFFRKTSALK